MSIYYLFSVQVDQQKESLVISGQYVESPRQEFLVKEFGSSQKKFCPKCTLGLDIKHTDVLILSQYIRSDGCMLPRRITGLCKVQQKRIGTLVTMAQKAGNYLQRIFLYRVVTGVGNQFVANTQNTTFVCGHSTNRCFYTL